MEENVVIYVAGNPNAYPLEYYDVDSQAYEGVIPQLLQEFSAKSGYEVVYYQPDGKDHREQLARNHQVDILSGYTPGESVPHNAGTAALFRATHGEKELTYSLYFTDAAPESLQTELEAFLTSVSQEKVSGLLIDAASAPQSNHALVRTAGALALVVALLLATIALLVRNYRRKLKKAQQDIETDDVTGIGNLDYFARYYKQFVNDKNRILYQLYYFYVDADHLRRIGGSQETDEFLRYCAIVLQEYASDTDILARVSDHGFVMLKLASNTSKVNTWVNTVLERVRDYSRLYTRPFEVNMSIGLYPLQQKDRALNEMIFNAYQCAFLADRDGQDYVLCSEQLLQKFVEEKQLQASVEQALARNEFRLYIQFYVDAETSKIVGGEVLSRWHHPEKGVLMPALFVPLMEREKLISKLDYYCLQEVCEFLQSLVAKKIDKFFVSCNFSRETFAAADFVERAKEIMDRYSFPRELLIFEITESSSSKNVSPILSNIQMLKEYGVSVVLDDFGEGFTSFYDLQSYPMDGIKLDKGLIDHIMTPTGNAILKSMIQVGHELNMTILAEGVEREEQVEALQAIHCDVIQGFYFHYPLPEWEAKNKILEEFAH